MSLFIVLLNVVTIGCVKQSNCENCAKGILTKKIFWKQTKTIFLFAWLKRNRKNYIFAKKSLFLNIMDIKIFIFIICGSVFLSCNKHTCSCKEVAGKAILDEYEKTIHNSLSCEDLNTTKYRGGDTIEVVCGDANPL